MIRLGLCCTFAQEPIRFRKATATYLLKRADPLSYLDEIVTNNIALLEKAIQYCKSMHIYSFRVSSQILPVATHPTLKYSLEDPPSADRLKEALNQCHQSAMKVNVRLTFHPDQFVNINSDKESVILQSITDLEFHAKLAEMIGADVINIHGGVRYGDKAAALKRFADNFKKLPPKVQRRLTIENDVKSILLLIYCLSAKN